MAERSDSLRIEVILGPQENSSLTLVRAAGSVCVVCVVQSMTVRGRGIPRMVPHMLSVNHVPSSVSSALIHLVSLSYFRHVDGAPSQGVLTWWVEDWGPVGNGQLNC